MTTLLQRRPEQAPMLTQVWPPDLAPVVGRLMASHPDAARRLALAPRRMTHMVAIWLRHAVSVGMEPEEMAVQIASRDARDLLREALPDHSARLPAALGRLGARVRSPDLYARLHAVLDGAGAAVLPTTGELRTDHLAAAELAAEAGYPVFEVARATSAGSGDLQALVAVLAFLRAHGLARDIEALPPGAGWRAVLRRLLADLDRGRAQVPACPAPPGWIWVETVGQLRDIGRGMGLCVRGLDHGAAAYFHDMLTGRITLLHRPGDDPLLASLRNEGPGLWSLNEVVRTQNATAAFGLPAELRRALRAAGLVVLDAPIIEAFVTLAQNATPAPPMDRQARQHRLVEWA